MKASSRRGGRRTRRETVSGKLGNAGSQLTRAVEQRHHRPGEWLPERARVSQDLQRNVPLLRLVGRELVEPVEYQHVPGSRQPVEIGEAVVDGVPVVAKVVREAQDASNLLEEPGASRGL